MESFVRRRRLLSNYHQLSSDTGNARLVAHPEQLSERASSCQRRDQALSILRGHERSPRRGHGNRRANRRTPASHDTDANTMPIPAVKLS